VPHPLVLLTSVVSAIIGLASKHWVVGQHIEAGYMPRTALHVSVGICLLLLCVAIIYETDGPQLMGILRSHKVAKSE